MEEQQIFIEAIESLKEFATLNGGVVTKQDILDHLKGIELKEGQLQLVYGYLKNNKIKITDVELNENAFEEINSKSIEKQEDTEDLQLDSSMQKEIDKENDKKLVAMYLEDLKIIDTIIENEENLLKKVLKGDKNSENKLIEAYLPKIVEWVEPFGNKGVPSGDLIQEGNLILLTQIKEKSNLNVKDWITNFAKILKEKVEDACNRSIEEQKGSYIASKKVLNKVNAVNDCAVKLSKELERKATIEEVAASMGISAESVKEAIEFSSQKIEDIVVPD